MKLFRLIMTAGFALGALSCAPVQPADPDPGAAIRPKSKNSFPATDREEAKAASGPAGILLYCRHGGEIHILVANDRLGSRGWGGFVGGNKKDENTAMTAARETHEETRGYYEQQWLLQKISAQQAVKQWGCHWYFAEVPYVPAKEIMNHPVPLLNLAYMETQHYAWVPLSEIEPLLTKKSLTEADLRLHPRHLQPGSRSNSYWRIWIDNIRQLQLKDAFPWSR